MWWREYRLALGELGRWRIGALSLWIRRRKSEWRITSHSTNDGQASEIEVDCPSSTDEPLDGVTMQRIASRELDDRITLAAALADRPVVAHPHTPLSLLGGQGVTIFVGLPLWVEISSGSPARSMLEIPIYRPSDTWFGPSTTSGELCYGSKTNARLTFEDLPFQAVRAFTAVHLENQAKDPMRVEKINIPAPYLSLYADASQVFWTQSVTIQRDSDGETGLVRFSTEPPEAAKDPRLIRGPRLVSSRNAFSRAFNALLG